MLTGSEIAAIRKALGWSLAKLAGELGVSEGAVRLWEAGHRHPRWETMCKLNELAEKVRAEREGQPA